LKILASRRFPGPAWSELRDLEYLSGPLPENPGRRRADIEALAVVGERVDNETLDLFPNLKIVANYGVGYDSIDVGACAARGVVVTNTPGVLTDATADLAFALLLAVRRRIVVGDRAVRDRLADSAEANDSKRRAAHVAAEEVGIGPAPTPAAVAHRAIADDDASSHRQ